MARLADKLKAGPKTFVQKKGPRKGQTFSVVTGKSGLSVRKYASGDTAIAQTDSGVSIPNQKRDVAARRQGPPPGYHVDESTPGGTLAKESASGTAGARSPRPAVLRNQARSDIADTAKAAELYKRFLDKQRPAGARMTVGGKRKTKLRW